MALFGQSGRGLMPPVIKGLLIANIAVFVLQHYILGFIASDTYKFFVGYLALWPLDTSLTSMLSFQAGTFLPTQLLTYQFLHGDFWHLFFNMFMLWMFGTTMERVWGGRRFLSIYILAGIGAAFLHLGIMFATGAPVHPTVGASGSLFGILIAFAMTFPEERMIIFPIFIPIKSKYVIIGYMAIEVFSGLFRQGDGVAHFAHIGGAITAYLILKFASDSGLLRALDRIWPLKKTTDSSKKSIYEDYNQKNSQNYYSSSTQQPKKESKVYNYEWFTGKDKQSETPKPTYTESKQSSKSYVVNGEEINQSKIDEILDKINDSGYQSLSERERKILTELSKKL